MNDPKDKKIDEVVRHDYAEILSRYKKCYDYTKNNGCSSLFSVVGYTGSGKSHASRYVRDQILKEGKYVIRFSPGTKEEKIIKDGYFAPILMSCLIRSIYFCFLNNKNNLNNNLKQKCEDLIYKWRAFYTEFDIYINELEAAQNTSNNKKKKIQITSILLVLASLAVSLATALFDIRSSIGFVAIVIGFFANRYINKKENTKSNNSSDEINPFPNYSKNDYRNDGRSDIRNFIESINENKDCNEGKDDINNELFELIIELSNYCKIEPFLIIVDAAETINNTSDRDFLKKLVNLDIPFIWYISGRTFPLELKKLCIEKKNFHYESEYKLDLCNVHEIKEYLNLYNVQIDNKEPTKEQIIKLKDKSIYWLKRTIDSIEKKDGIRNITYDDFNSLIKSSNIKLTKKFFGFDSEKPNNWDNIKNSIFSKVLLSVLPQIDWVTFELVAKRCDIPYDKDELIIYCDDVDDKGYSLHKQSIKYRSTILYEILHTKNKKVHEEDISLVIEKIIRTLKELFLENTNDNTINQYNEYYFYAICRFYDYNQILNAINELKQILTADGVSLFDKYKNEIESSIYSYTNDARFVISDNNEVPILVNISSLQKCRYLIKTFEDLLNNPSFQYENDFGLLKKTFDKIKDYRIKNKIPNINRESEDIIEILLSFVRIHLNEYIEALKNNNNNSFETKFKILEFIHQSICFTLNDISKFNVGDYCTYKDEYQDILNILKIQSKDTVYDVYFDIFIDDVECDYIKNNDISELNNYLKNRITQLEDRKSHTEDYFIYADKLIYRFHHYFYTDDNLINLVDILFKNIFEIYKTLNEEERTKHSAFIDQFFEYINFNQLDEEVFCYLLENLKIEDKYDGKVLKCLLYSKNHRDDVVKLISEICKNYYDDNQTHKSNDNVVSIIKENNSVLSQIKYEFIVADKDISDYSLYISKIRRINFDSNSKAYERIDKIFSDIIEYIKMYKKSYKNRNYDDLNTAKQKLEYFYSNVIDLYFSVALFNNEKYLNYKAENYITNEEIDILKYLPEYYSKFCEKNKYKFEEYDFSLQLEIENTIIAIISYLFMLNDFISNGIIASKLEDKIKVFINFYGEHINDDVSTSHINIKSTFELIKNNFYRKVVNLYLVLDAQPRNNGVQNSYLNFTKVSFDEYFDDHNIYKFFYDNYDENEIFCNTLNIKKTLRLLNRHNKGKKFKSFNEGKTYSFKYHIKTILETQLLRMIRNPDYQVILSRNYYFYRYDFIKTSMYLLYSYHTKDIEGTSKLLFRKDIYEYVVSLKDKNFTKKYIRMIWCVGKRSNYVSETIDMLKKFEVIKDNDVIMSLYSKISDLYLKNIEHDYENNLLQFFNYSKKLFDIIYIEFNNNIRIATILEKINNFANIGVNQKARDTVINILKDELLRYNQSANSNAKIISRNIFELIEGLSII